MQAYPVYTVTGATDGERSTTIELRVQMDAGGGLPGIATPEAVVQVLVAAMPAAGAMQVMATQQAIQTTNLPTS